MINLEGYRRITAAISMLIGFLVTFLPTVGVELPIGAADGISSAFTQLAAAGAEIFGVVMLWKSAKNPAPSVLE